MSAYYEFKLPAKILSGDGALEHIPHELDSLGAHRPLLLSDQGLEQGEAQSLKPWIQNKSIQKAIESYRISPEKKAYLRTLKVKPSKKEGA